MIVRVLVICFTVFCGTSCPIEGFEQNEIEENTVTTIPYKTSAATSKNRFWYRGRNYDGNNPPSEEDLLFKLASGVWTSGSAAHEDMFVDPVDFSLTINKTRLEDDGFYSCKTYDKGFKYDLAGQVQVYIQPVVNIEKDVEDTPEMDVRVTCTVPRLFPTITADNFTMEWGDQAVNATFTEHDIQGDLYAKRYTLSLTHELQPGKTTITCTVTPTMGQPADNKITLENKQEKHQMTFTLDDPPRTVTENDAVKLACTFTADKSEVDLDMFTMKWGKENYKNWTDISGPNESFSTYTIEMTRDFTSADQDTKPSCSLKLTNGTEHTWSFSTGPKNFFGVSTHHVTPGGMAGITIGSIVGGALLGAGVAMVIPKICKKKKKENTSTELSE